jgi:hypothetical protein
MQVNSSSFSGQILAGENQADLVRLFAQRCVHRISNIALFFLFLFLVLSVRLIVRFVSCCVHARQVCWLDEAAARVADPGRGDSRHGGRSGRHHRASGRLSRGLSCVPHPGCVAAGLGGAS